VVVQEAGAELKKGDELVKVGERTVGNRFDVERALWGYKAGEKVDLAVLRDGKEMTVALTLNRGSQADAGNVPQPTLVSNPITSTQSAGNETPSPRR
jgi:hypothetical protein